jgi:hypothetical protein
MSPDLAPSGRTRININTALARLTGYELRRRRRAAPPSPDPRLLIVQTPPEPPDPAELAERTARVQPGDRLLPTPTFILSTVRSGSTLLRLVLDSHPEICSPHEIHLRRIGTWARGTARYSLEHLGIDERDLRYLLWDRLLYRELTRAGKSCYVNKTPNDSLIWSDLLACWPQARFIFLRRHPGAIYRSWFAAHGAYNGRDAVANDIVAYATGMEQAYAARGGLVVRYEDLTTDPVGETQRMCSYLGVTWTPTMIEYGQASHPPMRRGLGDWSDKVRSGRIQAAAAPPVEELPEQLRPIAESWGYLGTSAAADAVAV